MEQGRGRGGHLRAIGEELQPKDGEYEDEDEPYELHTVASNAAQPQQRVWHPCGVVCDILVDISAAGPNEL
jgi:hypothetical protein